MPADVIHCVSQNMPSTLTFLDCHSNEIMDSIKNGLGHNLADVSDNDSSYWPSLSSSDSTSTSYQRNDLDNDENLFDPADGPAVAGSS